MIRAQKEVPTSQGGSATTNESQIGQFLHHKVAPRPQILMTWIGQKHAQSQSPPN